MLAFRCATLHNFISLILKRLIPFYHTHSIVLFVYQIRFQSSDQQIIFYFLLIIQINILTLNIITIFLSNISNCPFHYKRLTNNNKTLQFTIEQITTNDNEEKYYISKFLSRANYINNET